MGEFTMPSLGADMDDGTLVEWLVQPGDRVTRGQTIAVIETAKGAIEVEVFQDGVVREIVVPEGEKVPVGTVLATLDDGGDGQAAPAPPATPATPAAPEPTPPAPRAPAPAPAPEPPATPRPSPAADRRLASPAARRAAEAAGLDLSTVTGSGPDGAVVLADVERTVAASHAEDHPAAPPQAPAPTMMDAIGAAMARSKREIPHYYLAEDIDLAAASAWLTAHNEPLTVQERVLPAALVIQAVARAARKYPELNGHFVDGAHRPSDDVHVGVAITLRGGGLVAPAIHHADTLDVDALMARLSDLVERARAGRLKGSEMTEATITVSSMGANGVSTVFPVIVPPQVAIVGVGRLTERPRVVDGAVVARPTLTVSLAGDHRVSNGHRGGLFLRALDRALQHPDDR